MPDQQSPTTGEGETNNEQAVNHCQTRAVPQTAATRTAAASHTRVPGPTRSPGGRRWRLPGVALRAARPTQRRAATANRRTSSKTLARTNPRWASDTTYQVLHWARVHPADLSAEELTWHGITSDIDPTTGTVAYSRGGRPMSPETTVGHRPAPDRNSSTTRNAPRSPSRAPARRTRLASDGNRPCNIARATN